MNDRRKQRRPPQKPQPRTAREIAFHVLDEHDRTQQFANRLLDRLRVADRRAADDSREQEFRLATELTYGVIRRQSTLDAIITPHVARPQHKVERPLWMLLRLGTYQLVFADGIPEHAAVNETVGVAKKSGGRGWPGFMNGVLRSIAREVTEEFATEPDTFAVPLTNGRYRKLSQAVFADPTTNAARYFAKAFSFPMWMAERWVERFGFEELLGIGFHCNTPPRLCVRVNSREVSTEEFLEALAEAGIDAHAGDTANAVWIDGPHSVTRLPGFADGWFTVQDESAIQAAMRLDPQPGETVLDMCAAPGTKTTHLAELMNNHGRIVATDVKADRLKRVSENVARLGTLIVEAHPIREDFTDIPSGPYDAVLVDAPCSNTGVLAKRPEARWRITAKSLAESAELQSRLLHAACDLVKPGGRILYSTCSIEPEENGQLVRAVLETHNEFQLAEEREFRPGQPADGGYQALLRRN